MVPDSTLPKGLDVNGTYLDTGDKASQGKKNFPFYADKDYAKLDGAKASSKNLIEAVDTPFATFPLKDNNGDTLKEVALLWKFRTDVVAMTTEAKTQYGEWRLAREASANWSWNASGKITANANEALIGWDKSDADKVVIPDPNKWTLSTKPIMEENTRTDALYFNQMLAHLVWEGK